MRRVFYVLALNGYNPHEKELFVFPYNRSNQHWILCIIHSPRLNGDPLKWDTSRAPEIFWLDSFPLSSVIPDRSMRRYLMLYACLGALVHNPPTAHVHHVKVVQQDDSHSCGYHCLANLRTFLQHPHQYIDIFRVRIVAAHA